MEIQFWCIPESLSGCSVCYQILQMAWAPFQHRDCLSWCGDSDNKDKTVLQPSYLYHGDPYTGKMDSHYLNQCWPSSMMSYGITNGLTHWGWDKMALIPQTIFSNIFSSMKTFRIKKKNHCNIFVRVYLTIIYHWFKWWLCTKQATNHYLK